MPQMNPKNLENMNKLSRTVPCQQIATSTIALALGRKKVTIINHKNMLWFTLSAKVTR